MKNLKIYFGVLTLLVAGQFSCEKTDNTYKGPTVVEFAPVSTSSTYTSAYSLTVKQANYVAGLDTIELVVNLVGQQQNKDLQIGYTLVNETVVDFPSETYSIAPTTAIEASHFNFVPARTAGTDGVLVIPANSSTAKLRINTIASQVSPDVSKRVVIRLLSSAELTVNPNFQYFIVVITRL